MSLLEHRNADPRRAITGDESITIEQDVRLRSSAGRYCKVVVVALPTIIVIARRR
jgi:hypothetical protein